MKTLFKVLAALFIIFVLGLVAGYFVLTNPGFQKRQIEKRLPEGSSLKHVRVTTGSLELSGLVVLLPDGTRIKLREVNTTFKPLAALFDQTIKLGAVQIHGLQIDLAASTPASPAPKDPAWEDRRADPAPARRPSAEPSKPVNPFEGLYELSEFDWLLDIESIDLNGQMRDAEGTLYRVEVKSGAIRPGEDAEINASIRLISDTSLQGGLKQFDSESTLNFRQKRSGGFETFRLESLTSGQDEQGEKVLEISQLLNLSVEGFEENGRFDLEFSADLPRPELFMPELSVVGALVMGGNAAGELSGESAKLTAANLSALAEGYEVLAMNLKKPMVVGGKQNLTGELLEVRISNFPLAWLGPWLPEGILVVGDPVSTQLSVSGDKDGALILAAAAPILLGPLSVLEGEARLLEQVTLMIDPHVNIGEDGRLDFRLNQLQVSDRYGNIMEGQLSGRMLPVERRAGNLFEGIQAEGAFSIGLQELFQQPALADTAAVLGGLAAVNLQVDGALEYPVQLRANVTALRPRSMPGTTKDFRLGLRARETRSGDWNVDGTFQAGTAARPSSELRIVGIANPGSEPLAFQFDVTGPRLSQADVMILAAAFAPEDSATPPVAAPRAPTGVPQPTTPRPGTTPSGPAGAPAVGVSTPPPWSGLDGTVSVKIEEVILESGQLVRDATAKILVTGPRLSLTDLAGTIGANSGISGRGEVLYRPAQRDAYAVSADFDFKKIDPSIFADPQSGAFPVSGLFDGVFNLKGAAPTLEDALENALFDLRVTGDAGVVTAFEVDATTQLGLMGLGGILGQTLNRPGITALSNALPYFNNIRYDSFILELKRGDDKRVMIPRLKLTGENLLFDGSGFIAASKLSEIMDQPLNLNLELGARGRLTNYLETLNLLQSATSEDGFRRWSRGVNIGGTLAKPNTEALTRILNDAARAALSRPQTPAPAPATPESATATEGEAAAEEPVAPKLSEKEAKQQAREQRRRDEIDAGIEIFNSLFGR